LDAKISYDEGHAHVAAIRVLRYRLGRPPTIEEIAQVLGSTVEMANHRLRALESLGIVAVVENPFEAHISVRDHLALEKLPAEASEEGLAEAVGDFLSRQEEKANEMMRLFADTDHKREKDEKQKTREEELRRFRPKKKAPRAPWERGEPQE
jgi:hypothetical protein